MKSVEQENLKAELDAIGPTKLVPVVIWNELCNQCAPFISMIESIEANWPDFVFLKLHVDEPPLFAPAAIPALVIFYQSVRIFEASGAIDQENFEKSLAVWERQWRFMTGRIEQIKQQEKMKLENTHDNNN
jgi:thioredoxin-like negative regulator of GroEL